MNEIEVTKIENSVSYLIQEMLENYSKEHNIPFDDALDLFSKSKTYEALYDVDTRLYREGPDYIQEWFENELSGK